ncbi:thioredoxin family protein [Thiohalophilus sp.]|uniref:thioredoxin family protein n=1 Tax=Thiohalophilus sp. TaxID=3028392 RepID=UPI002ACD6DFB|nr:thioredoxin fold domain-containing protein [Thiohalophilus sp.]MDZ7802900.1 thioredoxin fold domain-containing protein [Thiohalophilus sp.]
MRKLFGSIFVLLLALGTATLAAETRDPYKHFFHETWGDYQEELENAREQGKKGVLIFFEMDECPFCHYMKENVLNRQKVQEYYREHFLNFSVDIEGDVEITNLQGEQKKQKDFAFKENRVRATPVFAFYNLEGERIHRHTGKTSGVEEFMWMGEYVANGIYKDMSFTRYKREKRKE